MPAASPLRLSSTYVTAGAISLSLLLVAKSLLSSSSSSYPKPLPSPRTTLLPHLSPQEIADLPYPPDALPGARDVDTPYGSMRVYEWGPEDGAKVLVVHGISTPSIALAGVAEGLVKRGKRVMLFDLFGRGYSDTPADLPHDSRLYTTQILLALASSPLSWTGGPTTFSLAGYSLGGALAADFASHFPALVSSLVLLAPAGLLRASHRSWRTRLLYALPAALSHPLLRRRLHTPVGAEGGGAAAAAAVAARVVNWQIVHHEGFAGAFASSIQCAPVYAQQVRWRAVGARGTPVLLVLGEVDPIIVAEEVAADARECLGEGLRRVVVVEGAGHEVVMGRAGGRVVDAMMEFWEKEERGGGVDGG